MTFIWTSNSFVSPFEKGKTGKQLLWTFVCFLFKIFLNPTHGVKFVFNCIVLRNFIGVCCLSRAWQGGAGASVSWSDSGLEISARHRLCQGAIYVLAGCGLVWYQELLGGSKGPSLPRSQMFKFKIIYLRRLTLARPVTTGLSTLGRSQPFGRFSALNHHKPEKCSFHAET